jgi:hypothetical protein
MKKLVIILVLSLAFISGCDNAASPQTEAVNPLIGTWRWEDGVSFQQLVITEKIYAYTDDFSNESSLPGTPTIEPEVYSGAYIYNEATIVLYNFYTFSEIAMDYFIIDNKLYLYYRQRNILWDFTKQ